MNKSNIVSLVAGLIVGLIIGGLTVALVETREDGLGAHYVSDWIMRQQDRLYKCEQQNKELQKKIQELEQREKERPQLPGSPP